MVKDFHFKQFKVGKGRKFNFAFPNHYVDTLSNAQCIPD